MLKHVEILPLRRVVNVSFKLIWWRTAGHASINPWGLFRESMGAFPLIQSCLSCFRVTGFILIICSTVNKMFKKIHALIKWLGNILYLWKSFNFWYKVISTQNQTVFVAAAIKASLVRSLRLTLQCTNQTISQHDTHYMYTFLTPLILTPMHSLILSPYKIL